MSDRPRIGFSMFWDVYVPLGISSIPMGCFKLMRFLLDHVDKPGAKMATWQVVVMATLQLAGVVSMAVVVLVRLEVGMKQLNSLPAENQRVWRRWSLLFSFGCLALFDIFLNVGLGFPGAAGILVLSAVWYIAYLVGIRLAFFRLQNSE